MGGETGTFWHVTDIKLRQVDKMQRWHKHVVKRGIYRLEVNIVDNMANTVVTGADTWPSYIL